MTELISRKRVMRSDPRRWPIVLQDSQINTILEIIYGEPDEYAKVLYSDNEGSEQKLLAVESKKFISQHVTAELTTLKRAIKAFPLYSRTILDLGSRDGRLFAQLIKPGKNRCLEFKNYFGVEIDKYAFDLLKRRLQYDETAHAVLGDITKLDKAIHRIKRNIESPIVCILQNTLGSIKGSGDWRDVISHLGLILDKFKNAEIILSLYKPVKPECSIDQIKKALKVFEQCENLGSELEKDQLQEAIKLLGNGWLLPSYLYTKNLNGWPPNPEMLAQGKLYIPSSGYTSQQWTELDIMQILQSLGVKVAQKQEEKEFAVLRLTR